MNHPVNSSLSRHYTFLIALQLQDQSRRPTANVKYERASRFFITFPLWFSNHSNRYSSIHHSLSLSLSPFVLAHFDARTNDTSVDNFSIRTVVESSLSHRTGKIKNLRSKSERNARRFDFPLFIHGNESWFPRLSELVRQLIVFYRNVYSYVTWRANAEQHDCGEQTKRGDLSRWPCSGQISTTYSVVKELTVRYNLVISDHFHEEEETVKRGRITWSTSIPSRFPPRLSSANE